MLDANDPTGVVSGDEAALLGTGVGGWGGIGPRGEDLVDGLLADGLEVVGGEGFAGVEVLAVEDDGLLMIEEEDTDVVVGGGLVEVALDETAVLFELGGVS